MEYNLFFLILFLTLTLTHFCFSFRLSIIFIELFRRAKGQNKRDCKRNNRLFCLEPQPSVISSILTLTPGFTSSSTRCSPMFLFQSEVAVRPRLVHVCPLCCSHLLSLKYCNCINPQLRSCYRPHVLIWHV